MLSEGPLEPTRNTSSSAPIQGHRPCAFSDKKLAVYGETPKVQYKAI